MKTTLNKAALRSATCLSAALAFGFAANAQAQETAPADEGSQSAIVVTGSRIARPDLEAPVPLAVVTSDALTNQGATNVQDVLNELPQVGIGTSRTNTNFSTGGNGVATVDLRNLGNSRTLVLVNGRRFVSGLASSSAVDINNIPADFVERVEVITGGASSIYGSDAIAGVVNFVLKDKYEGVMAHAQYGITDRGDNPRYTGSLTGGLSFGPEKRGNIIANFTYDKDTGLYSRKRGISDQDCFLNASPDECGPAFYSSYAAQGRFELLNAAGARQSILPGDNGLFTFDPDNSLVYGFPVGYGFNRNAERRISVPVERYLASAIANYELTDNIKVYGELTYGHVKASSQIEATPLDYTDPAFLGFEVCIGRTFPPRPSRQPLGLAAGGGPAGFPRPSAAPAGRVIPLPAGSVCDGLTSLSGRLCRPRSGNSRGRVPRTFPVLGQPETEGVSLPWVAWGLGCASKKGTKPMQAAPIDTTDAVPVEVNARWPLAKTKVAPENMREPASTGKRHQGHALTVPSCCA